MAERFRHEDVSAVPSGWKVRTVSHGGHRVRVAFPPGRRRTGAGRLVSILHPIGENPCELRSSNPAELVIMGANPPRKYAAQTKRELQRVARERAEAIRAARLNPQMYAIYSTRETGKLQLDKIKRSLSEADQFANRLRDRGYAAQVVGPRGRLDFRKYLNPSELIVMGANPRVEVVHGDNPPVEEIVERFSGAPAEWIDVYNEPHMKRGRYAQLGPLIALYIKPVGGGQVRRIGAPENRNIDWKSYWGGDPPVIVTDTTARKIYFVGGNQDITAALESFGPRDRGEGLLELGQCRRIDYEGRKEHVADPDEDQWKHDHGEENGVLPTVLFDTRVNRLLYEGGDYRIDGAWIRN